MRALAFALMLLLTASPASADWWEASTDHFVVLAEGSPQSARDMATKLERFDAMLRFLRDMPKDEAPGKASRLTVFVLPDEAAVRQLYGDTRSSVAGFYVPRASGSVAFVPRNHPGNSYTLSGQTVLLHEYAHHFMLSNYMAAYPAWFVEGFAEFYSTVTFEKDGGLTFGQPAVHRAMGLFYGTRLPIEKLLTGLAEGNAEAMDVYYGRAWVLTHYLTFEPTRANQLDVYLRNIGKGMTSIESAKAAFGDLGKLNSELDRYIRHPMQYRKIAAGAVTVAEPGLRRLTAGEEAVIRIRMQLTRTPTGDAAKRLLAEARRRAALAPESAEAQLVLAAAEYQAGNDEQASAAADLALKRDPKSVDALLYKGRVEMRLAAAPESSEAKWNSARSWFIKANRADTDDPEPLIYFYRTFVEAGLTPTRNAVMGLEEAFARAPHDPELRMMLGRQLLADKKIKEARNVLAPIAFSPHGGGASKASAAVLKLIDDGVTDNLLETLDRELAALATETPAPQ